MKKIYIRPTIHTLTVKQQMLCNGSNVTFNLSNPQEADAAEAASRSIDDDGWGDD